MKKLIVPKKSQTKRGVASLYVVIFATILFGVVTLSFMRIILSEATQSSDDDLSRSAYDAALAGVEDAKRAVNEYYRCLGTGTGTGTSCNTTAKGWLFKKECTGTDGIGIAKYLNIAYEESSGVLIKETGNNRGDSTFTDQAYTCVIVSDKVPDYRGTLTSDTRTKVVPINIVSSSGLASDIAKVGKITLEWYSQLNMGSGTTSDIFEHLDNNGQFADKNNSTTPPAISVSFIAIHKDATMDEVHQANNISDKVIYSTKILLPTDNTSTSSELSWSELFSSGDVKHDTDKDQHKVIPVSVSTAEEFACKYTFNVDGNLSDQYNVVMVVSLPYGNLGTDFSVKMIDATTGMPVYFTGAQLSVDSTGRTNQLFRRVEVRLDPADLFFPYPQYEVDLGGSGDDIFKKDFWITANCWYSQPTGWDEQICNNNNYNVP